MASTVRDVGTLALKKLGVLRAGGEMKAPDGESARASLQSYLMGCVNAGTFGRVGKVVVSTAQAVTAAYNQHVNATVGGVTVDLPETMDACFWENFEPYGDYGWPWCSPYYGDSGVTTPRDKSVVMVTSTENDDRLVYVFDATVQRWMRLDNLTLNAEAPLSARDVDGLASVLAVRLSDEYGIDPRAATVLAASRYKMALVSAYGDREAC